MTFLTPIIFVTQTSYCYQNTLSSRQLCYETLLFSNERGKVLEMDCFFINIRQFEGILKTARPIQTRPNSHIPVQNDGMAGL